MKTIEWAVAVLVFSVWLTGFAAGQAFDAADVTDEIVAYRLPLITLPRLKQPPLVNGAVDAAEWSHAAQVAGLHTQVSYMGGSGLYNDEPAQIWLGYDEEALYVAFRTERPPHARIPRTEYEPSESETSERGVWRDDCVEILIAPPDDHNYHLAVNVGGYHADGILRSSTDRSWNGDWQSAARLTNQGWEMEARIPFETLGQDTPKKGALWRFYVLRNRKTPDRSLGSLSYLTGWGDPGQYARIVFGGRTDPVVAVSQMGVVGLEDVGLDLRLEAGQRPTKLLVQGHMYRKRDDVVTFMGENKLDAEKDILIPITVDWAFYQKFLAEGWSVAMETTSPVKSWSETVTLTPGSRESYLWKTPVQEGKYLCTYSVRDAETGRLIAARAMPFQKTDPLRLTVEPWVLMNKELRIEVQYDKYLASDEQVQVQVSVQDAAAGDLLKTLSAPIDSSARRNIFRLPCEQFMGKKLQIHASLEKPGGQVLFAVQKESDIPHLPDWLNNSYGISEEVPPPWTPIQVEADRASVALRTYELGPGGLPRQIVSRGKELLAGPVELLFTGKPLSWKRSLKSSEPGKVIWQSEAKVDGCRMQLTSALEFDGMIRYDLTFLPSEPMQLKHVELVIPYLASLNREPLPIIYNEFEPRVELGDYEVGLCWAAEWAKGWQIGSRPVIELQPQGKQVDWRIRLIGEEGKTIAEPLTITWILHALPVKPWNDEYRKGRMVTGVGGGTADIYQYGRIPESMTENTLSYPLARNWNSQTGSLLFHVTPGDTLSVPRIQLMQIRARSSKLVLQYERVKRPGDRWPYKQSIVLYNDKEEIARLFPVMRPLNTPWLPVGMSWQQTPQGVQVQLMTEDSKGTILTSEAQIPNEDWQNMMDSNWLVFGGRQTIALDDVMISDAPMSVLEFQDKAAAPAKRTPSTLLLDSLDRVYLQGEQYVSRAEYMQKGQGAIIGAPLMSSFVKKIEGAFGAGVLIPAGVNRSMLDYVKSLGSSMTYPHHGQWQNMCGYYSPNFVPDPVLKEKWDALRAEGLGITVYNGFAFEPKYDNLIGPYMNELARQPISLVYTAYIPCLATPAVDYFVWGLKRSIDYYGIHGLHLDNTWDCRSICMGHACGCAWTDDTGNLHGRHPIFATREMAKRYYQLMKVYRKKTLGREGMISLHAGGSRYPMVAAFTDIRKHGEGGAFSTSDFARKPFLPEEFNLLMNSRRVGVPVELLTKGGDMPYGPNYLYLYTLLYNLGLRTRDIHLFPNFWHMDPDHPRPIQEQRDLEDLPQFNPYEARIGLSSYPLPTALWWQLQDDFDCASAKFLPFWSNQKLISPKHERVRCSAWWHAGRSLLIVAGNFTGEDVDVTLGIDWKGLGLRHRDVEAFDAYTGQSYPVSSHGVTISIQNGPYRLIRIESL